MISVFGITADDLQPMLLSTPSEIQDIFDYLSENYGSVEAYLTEAVGLSEEMVMRLRE